MALITCPECGREISDKAVSCPGCGCPVAQKSQHIYIGCEQGSIEIRGNYLSIYNSKGKIIVNDKIDKLLLLFYGIVTGAYVFVFSHESLNGSYGCRVKKQYADEAKELSDIFQSNGNKIDGLSYWKAFKYKNDAQILKKQQDKEKMRDNLQAISNMGDIITGKNKAVKCPKCHSTSISYTNKKLSLGRTAVGAAVAGAPGAVIGGLSSKKGYAVCLNCGKKWKI